MLSQILALFLRLLVKLSKNGLTFGYQHLVSNVKGFRCCLSFFSLMCSYLFKKILIEVPVLSILYTFIITQECTLVKFSYIVHCKEKVVLTVIWLLYYCNTYVKTLMWTQCFYFTNDWSRILIWGLKTGLWFMLPLPFIMQSVYWLSCIHLTKRK